MPKWCTRLPTEFREQLTSFGKSYEEIEKACLFMDVELKKLKNKIPLSIQKKFEDEKYNDDNIIWEWRKLSEAIDENIDHFDFCKDFANNTIKREEWDDYSFDGDLLGLFNDYLTEFWNICDTVINDKHHTIITFKNSVG